MVHKQLEKGFPDMRPKGKRIKFIRLDDSVNTAGQLKGEWNAFPGLQSSFIALRQKIPTEIVALGDCL